MSGWHIRDKQWPMRKNGSMLLYVHRNHKAHYDGEPRTATSTFTQLLNSEPEKFISVQLCCLMSSDVGRDKLWPMRKRGSMLLYVHKKPIKLVRTDSPGRPPRLSHSSHTAPEQLLNSDDFLRACWDNSYSWFGESGRGGEGGVGGDISDWSQSVKQHFLHATIKLVHVSVPQTPVLPVSLNG